jgi:hypothetical protein
MADTHRNRDHETEATDDGVIRRLTEQAAAMSAAGTNTITTGKPGENAEEEIVGTFLVRKLPDDPDCLRVSLGEPNVSGASAYVVVRGNIRDAVELLERAAAALSVSRLEWRGP